MGIRFGGETQDAAKRGDLIRRIVTDQHGERGQCRAQDCETCHAAVETFVDAAVAEAHKERDRLYMKMGKTIERQVAEARREERERLVNIAIREGVSSYVIKILGASAPFTEKGRAAFGDAYPTAPPPSRVNPAPSAPEGEK